MANEDFSQHTIIVFSEGFQSMPELLANLRTSLPGLNVKMASPTRSEEEVIRKIQDSSATIALIGHEPVGTRTVQAAKGLKLVLKYGVGVENLDLDAFRADGAPTLAYPAGINRLAVAELVFAFLLIHFRQVEVHLQSMRGGLWKRQDSRSLSGLKLGLVGFGNIGQCVARLAQPFGIDVVYNDIEERALAAQALGARAEPYGRILESCDCVSFHVPLTVMTQGMLGAAEIRRLRPDALVINTARGAVVDHEEAVRAVQDGRIGGYAADVFVDEPLGPERLPSHPRLYLTPHIGAFSREARRQMGGFCIDAAVQYLRGVTPPR